MDHKTFVSSLTVEQRRSLTRKSDRLGLQALGLHIGAIVIASIWIMSGFVLWQLMLVVQGVLLVFLFTCMHECVHRTVFATSRLNDWVAAVCGFVLALAPAWFRYFHFAHHRFTQDPQKDPELESSKPETKLQYCWHVSGLPIWRSHLAALWRNATGQGIYAYVPKGREGRITSEARLMLVLYVLVVGLAFGFGVLSWLLWLWIIPLFLGQPILRVYLLAEHGKCPLVLNMFENTRTTFTNRLVRRLAWNMPYHAEHHAFPTVPFHNLPKLHNLAKSQLKITSDGYVQFNRSYVKGLSDEAF